jgi:alkyldihydroxyacetonephosphate synthase
VYREGVCLYIYYGLNECDNQLEVFKKCTDFVKRKICENGGSLSHHHGIGTKNSKRYNQVMPKLKKDIFRNLKEKIDPKNIFCVRNFQLDENEQKNGDLKAKL